MSEVKTLLASRVKQFASHLGEAIEDAIEDGMIVSLEVYYNDGSESVVLPRVNGEFRVVVGSFQEF